ncbi:hypothetical protein EMPG_13137 [Blastomyces silverae]|uniref:Uncharacterized protein n=1 Tax=Blastomyces silverae TaxID=2060906 RepID=A0A0H1BKW6_9EURO|nr:hypothetical protein EMPG_13137 [Blastomyces silverae]
MERALEWLKLGCGVRFKNHLNTLNEEVEEVQQHLQAQGLSMNSLSYLIEYKPPHKLRGTDIERGLRPMDLEHEVVHKYRIPKDSEKRKQHDADRKVASVVTQTFDYMIDSGLEYSYLSMEKAFIFLKVEEADSMTVFYHRIMLDEEQHTADDPKTVTFHTAVAQGILPEMPDNLKRPKMPPTSEFKGKSANLALLFNLRARPTGRSRCNEDETLVYTHLDDDSSSEKELGDKEIPISSQTRNQTREYCTQACLLGLVWRTALDEDCLNVSAHRADCYGREHRISVEKFRRLVQAQLNRTLDQDCEPLWKQGARGNLFRITLASHGYTFVGKGMIPVYVPDLQHESCIYRQLERLQGQRTPVYLGNIRLVEPWVDIGVEIVHMLLMS